MKALPLAKPNEAINAYVIFAKPQSRVIWRLKHIWLKITVYRPRYLEPVGPQECHAVGRRRWSLRKR